MDRADEVANSTRVGRRQDFVERRPRELFIAGQRLIWRCPGFERRGNRRWKRMRLSIGERLFQRCAQALGIDRLRGRKQREIGKVLHARVGSVARQGFLRKPFTLDELLTAIRALK